MAKYDQFFVNVMMVEELGLQVPSPDDDPFKEGQSLTWSVEGAGLHCSGSDVLAIGWEWFGIS